MAVQKQGGKSKKGRQHVHNETTHKYARQARRTAAHKREALELHLTKHPNDEQNKKDIKTALKKYQQ
jgi:hypothetical protein